MSEPITRAVFFLLLASFVVLLLSSILPIEDVEENKLAVALSKENANLMLLLRRSSETADSLILVNEKMSLVLDRVVQLSAQTKVQMERYASIVKRDPSQSVFIVGWTRSAFLWVDSLRVEQ